MRIKSWKLFIEKLYYKGINPTSDTIVIRNNKNIKEVLLIKRSDTAAAEPGKWSIPGGFVDTTSKRDEVWISGFETPLEAAKREVLEETGLDLSSIDDNYFKLLGVYDDINRDPRNTKDSWIESNTFVVEIPYEISNNVKGMDDAQDAKWFNIDELFDIDFAFDHRDRFIELGFIK